MSGQALAPAPRGAEAGYSLIETLIGTVVLAVSILVYVQCIGTESRLGRATQEKALAVVTLGRFLERLRADSSWSTLYDRLRPLSSEGKQDPDRSDLGIDTALRTWPVTDYFSDVGVPASLGAISFLVQVPSDTVFGNTGLHESSNAPRYGLPHDLNGDGRIDSNPHSGDYTALPVVVRLRWERPGQAAREVLLATWLRGER
jgi:type II secretory pathway pseudopilin PulG